MLDRQRLLVVMLAVLLAVPGAIAAPQATTQTFLPTIRTRLNDVDLIPFGAPIWRPADVHIFAAPIGFSPDYAEAQQVVNAILPPPNHENGGIGAPHPPPYDTELAQGVANQGYKEGERFATADFSTGNGIFMVWMTLPAPGTIGSSTDFDAGPIIPLDVFPMTISGVANHDGAVFDPSLTNQEAPRRDDLGVDGISHYAVYTATNQDFGPPGADLAGSYEYRVTIVDVQGNGWVIVARFTLTPESAANSRVPAAGSRAAQRRLQATTLDHASGISR
jgi:hypothetical protein